VRGGWSTKFLETGDLLAGWQGGLDNYLKNPNIVFLFSTHEVLMARLSTRGRGLA
jgi:hypothetical protein